MDHTTALDLILSHACPESNEWSEAEQAHVSTFVLDLHCKVIKVEAVLVSTVRTIKWRIVHIGDAD